MTRPRPPGVWLAEITACPSGGSRQASVTSRGPRPTGGGPAYSLPARAPVSVPPFLRASVPNVSPKSLIQVSASSNLLHLPRHFHIGSVIHSFYLFFTRVQVPLRCW